MRRLSLFGAWSLVLVLTTTLTWQIVNATDDRVRERPVSPLNVGAPVIPAVDTPTTVATTVPETTSTSLPPQASTKGSSSTTPTPGSVGTSPTSTTAGASWSVQSVPTTGGVVVVKYRPKEVVLQTATPAAGFQAEVKKGGPPAVKVVFESGDLKVEFQAEWDDGELDVEVSESPED